MPCRRLVIVLGDQLDRRSAALDGFDASCDAVWMAEVPREATHVPSHRARIALFLAAMRHWRDELRGRGFTVHYRQTGAHAADSLGAALAEDLERLRPALAWVVLPGDRRVADELAAAAGAAGVPLTVLPDRHFLCTPEEFAGWARGRRELRLEHFYRWMRRRTGLLMDGDQPAGGAWNFDADNRESFGPAGPGPLPAPLAFPPDALTAGAIADVARHYPASPGSLARFDWPVTPADAARALADFVEHRLAGFGRWQDALWAGEPWLYHSRLSAALNLKLITPLECCRAAEAAWRAGRAPLAAVEGFIRQILGWREYVRGIYHREMPGYLGRNALGAELPLPPLYWTGRTQMACLADAVGQTLEYGYAHHIQRLMVTGLFALLAGVRPAAVHEWYLAVYVDAVEWVEAPNTLGMSQYADGGLLASKPYVASGKYLERMGNHCRGCRFDPAQRTGDRACPFTTLYWDFLDRHEARFRDHPRLALQVRNLARLDESARAAIREQAGRVRAGLAAGTL